MQSKAPMVNEIATVGNLNRFAPVAHRFDKHEDAINL